MNKHVFLLFVVLLVFAACQPAAVECSEQQCSFEGECIDEMGFAGEQICLGGELVDLPSAPDAP